MAVRVKMTEEDLAGGKLVEPGWYPLIVTDYEEKPADTDGSTNSFITMKVMDGPFKGARVRHMVNEKFGWGYNPNPSLLLAFGAQVKPGVGIDIEISKDNLVGRKLDGYIKRGTSNKGNAFNELADCAVLGKMSKYKVPA